MKKLMVMIMAAGLLVSSASLAVELEADCAYVYDVPTGFDYEFAGIAALLHTLNDELPSTPALYDLESVTGPMSGDGLPDAVQLAMLGAVMCDPSGAAIVTQFNNNQAAYMGLIADLSAVVDAGSPLAVSMPAVGQDIIDWATAIPDGADPALDALKAQSLFLGNALIAGGEDVGGFLTEYGPVIVSVFPLYKEWFAGMGGLSTEMGLTLDGLLGDLLSGLTDAVADLQAAADGLVQLAVAGTTLVPPPWTMTTELAGDMNALAGDINTLIPLLTAVTLPDFEIYGVAKTASEPFSAAADYNGDGVTNGDTYTYVTDGGGDRALFISAATGTNPFWPGNPGLPVSGVFGLAALVSVVASAGAMVIRKK